MLVKEINDALLAGVWEQPGLFPHLDLLRRSPVALDFDFGLPELPTEEGILLIRGARQVGKSTWLEQQLFATVKEFGAGSAFYLNGDELDGALSLQLAIREFLPLFSRQAHVRRLFIDEITAVADWQKALKRLVDAGELRGVLVVTTGSKATDLRRAGERLPGRKGRLARTEYIFTPVSFATFKRAFGARLGPDCLAAYLLSGGCPTACVELGTAGHLPEFVPEIVRDWILGECVGSGRSRASLLAVMNLLHRGGAAPISQAHLAREAGMANNTVAAGYLEVLADLMCIGTGLAWDAAGQKPLLRRPAKHPFVNLLAAVSWGVRRLRSPADFHALPPSEQGVWLEWLVAQELWRRAAIRAEPLPEQHFYWSGKRGEVDFVRPPNHFIECKRGRVGLLDYGWFSHSFPEGMLTVVGAAEFSGARIRGIGFESFLSDESSDLGW